MVITRTYTLTSLSFNSDRPSLLDAEFNSNDETDQPVYAVMFTLTPREASGLVVGQTYTYCLLSNSVPDSRLVRDLAKLQSPLSGRVIPAGKGESAVSAAKRWLDLPPQSVIKSDHATGLGTDEQVWQDSVRQQLNTAQAKLDSIKSRDRACTGASVLADKPEYRSIFITSSGQTLELTSDKPFALCCDPSHKLSFRVV